MSTNGDKRSVSTDALDSLGTIINEGEKRDAIHLAVEPVVAGENLGVGADITLTNGKAYKTKQGEGLGIVDPFLKKGPKAGERFWLVVYPRQIKSLRHVWSHPAFPEDPSLVTESEEDKMRKKASSEKWLRVWFQQNTGAPDYDLAIQAIANGRTESEPDEYGECVSAYVRDEYLHVNGKDAHGEIPAEFWEHAERVLGKHIKNRPVYFSCSC